MAFAQAGTCASQRYVDDAFFIAHLQSARLRVLPEPCFFCGFLPRIKDEGKRAAGQVFLR
jgi:hypothetical protein